MNVTVNYFGQIRQITGRDHEPVACGEAEGVSKLLTDLAGQYGDDFRKLIIDEAGSVRSSLLILVNGQPIDRHVHCALTDGDEVTLLPPIAGG